MKGVALSMLIAFTTVASNIVQYADLKVTALTQSESYSWKNVKIGGGGGFIPGIIFNPTEEGLFTAVQIWVVFTAEIRRLRNGFLLPTGFS